MGFEPGQPLLHYRLVEKLGEGGMGVVWKARDTTLDREVAIKVLPEAFSQDADRLARFEREAKLLAGLNHPNIAAVYSVHRAGDTHFLAMELLPGEDLAQRLRRGPLPEAEAVDCALQIAAALEAAHESGVIHRDLKPANIVLTPDGKIKVLDFGLAKAFDRDAPASGSDPSLSPTVTSAGTMAGVILGTASYMSPEQARGRAADRRADIWAFGCVFVEMLTGRKVFTGETVSDILASVLKSDPAWDDLPDGTPPRVRRLLERCLRKDPRRRLRDAGDARILLEESTSLGEDEGGGPSAAVRRPILPWAVAALMTAAALWVLLTGGGTGPGVETVRTARHLALRLSPGIELGLNVDTPTVAISPDGGMVAYVGHEGGDDRLYLQPLDGGPAVAVEGSDRGTGPFFSPDGEWLGFFAQGKLRKVPVRGGSPIDLLDAGIHRGAAWAPDGTIVASTGTVYGLVRLPATGGAAEALTELDTGAEERTHRWPSVLPDGKTVLFTIGVQGKPGDYEDADIGAVSLETGERRIVYRGASMARYVPTGHLLVATEGRLSAVPFDVDRLEATGDPVPLLHDVAGEASSGVSFFDISSDGTLVYVERDPKAKELRMAWVDRDGEVEPIPAPFREYRVPRISPDGARIAVGIGPAEGRESDLWIYEIQRDTLTRLTFDQRSSTPVWSPDGRTIAYGTRVDNVDVIARKPADGSGELETLVKHEQSVPGAVASFTPDGRHLIYTQGRETYLLSIEDGDKVPILSGPGARWGFDLSRDGKWLAYSSDDSGEAQVYVRSMAEGGGRWQVSDAGSTSRWSADGKELFYVDANRFYVVPVETQPTFSPGKPRLLFEVDHIDTPGIAAFDVSPDGQRFLVIQHTSEADTTRHLNVVVDAYAALRGPGGS